MARKAERIAQRAQISQVGDFKQRLGGLMELPSGVKVITRNPGGLKAFMTGSNIPNSLMLVIQNGLKSGQAPKAEDIMPEGKLDAELLEGMTVLLDNVTMTTIVEPPIHAIPTQDDVEAWNKNPANKDDQVQTPEDLRDDEIVYVDEIPDIDKQFLLQWVSGGTRDLERFRRELADDVQSIHPSYQPASDTK